MNYDKIKRTGILFLLGIGAITSLSCNDNDNANYPERVPTRLSVMPLPERVDYKESVVSLPQNVTVHKGEVLFPRIDMEKEIDELNSLLTPAKTIREDEDLDKANVITIDQFAEAPQRRDHRLREDKEGKEAAEAHR